MCFRLKWNAEITTFIDETNDKLKEVYVSELFGYLMIFTSELSLDDVESWNLPIHLFAEIHINGAFVVRDSEGKLHPELNRPIEKTVLLPIRATFTPDKVEMELHEIQGL